MRLYVGLVHFPVYNKHRETIASAITPLDIHDFARLGKTYDVSGLFVITPLEDQQALCQTNFATLDYGVWCGVQRCTERKLWAWSR